eukprot:54004-Eustigmatos_ZCMA.PRE.1
MAAYIQSHTIGTRVLGALPYTSSCVLAPRPLPAIRVPATSHVPTSPLRHWVQHERGHCTSASNL